MGCAQSKIDNEESVARCKDRRNLMKEAVAARNAFAAGHTGYALALKNTGAALSDYAQGEAENHEHEHHREGADGGVPQAPMMMDPTLFPPPPPPLPTFSPATPLQRSVTMPELSASKTARKMTENVAIAEEGEESEEAHDDADLQPRRDRRARVSETPLTTPPPPPPPPHELKGMAWDYFFMDDDMPDPSLSETEEVLEQKKENEVFDRNFSDNAGRKMDDVEPKTPEKTVPHGLDTQEEVTPVFAKDKQFLHSNTAPADIERGATGKAGASVSLLKILGDIDDHFLKASEAAQEVSKMLEATRLHYHSNFADNRGHIDHARRVMQVITWNKSFKGLPNGDDVKSEYDAEDYETHATVLDKLLAWEKKLYEEVKAGELIKLEYQRKVAMLNKLKKRNASTESLEKMKAAVSHLHTRYIVDMQSLDSTVSEVNHIRDDQLYPKLVALVNGMAKMWESLCIHHDNQLKIVLDLKSLEIPGTPKETTTHHHARTEQLCEVINDWHLQFEKLVTNQKNYIRALNSWLKLNLIPIESSFKEKILSPPRIQNPPIHPLLHSWHNHLEKLPDELAKTAIASFGAVIKTIWDHQEEEKKLKEKCEETRKEYLRKKQVFEDWYQKYLQRKTPTDEADLSETNPKDPVSDRQFVVESLRKRLEDEIEVHQKHCVQVREKSLGSLKIRLPELFRAMSEYSRACLDAYERLRTVVQSQNANAARIS
ncbi:protein ALTERED PHOSPHATE STARVATION RESPONSE 1 [Diospyros lotus]|uniref:protein ALTERED PHOSPHATE STARVATION RESPONSE 1 n=1 Tax=Diospyros lotus TaxID=55363 RepID=UPI002254E8C6|nr:protein ALTERED PHOSPHATE STARVATION RESPONSE 1 [Diospyros lotus]XP_052210310.1 protein ALTERED PHOSPHATE STARVATION RESPONSE 1 [Diospyros lotus]